MVVRLRFATHAHAADRRDPGVVRAARMVPVQAAKARPTAPYENVLRSCGGRAREQVAAVCLDFPNRWVLPWRSQA